jgi:hypothetical protein
MAKFDWERAAREDYIARHGSVPHWAGYQRDEEERLERDEVDLRVRLQTNCMAVVAEFADLSAFERRRRRSVYFNRLCRLFDAERSRVGHTRRLAAAITDYERASLALLEGLLEADERDASEPST